MNHYRQHHKHEKSEHPQHPVRNFFYSVYCFFFTLAFHYLFIFSKFPFKGSVIVLIAAIAIISAAVITVLVKAIKIRIYELNR